MAEAREVAELLETERRAGTFPSYQALVVERGTTLFEAVAGDAVVEPEHQPACPIPFAVSRTPATMMTSAEIAGSAVARPPPKFSRVSTLRA